jgi:hypothetical protein
MAQWLLDTPICPKVRCVEGQYLPPSKSRFDNDVEKYSITPLRWGLNGAGRSASHWKPLLRRRVPMRDGRVVNPSVPLHAPRGVVKGR